MPVAGPTRPLELIDSIGANLESKAMRKKFGLFCCQNISKYEFLNFLFANLIIDINQFYVKSV